MEGHCQNESWNETLLTVTHLLDGLLNRVRDLGYNPSHHIYYSSTDAHILLDEEILKRHQEIAEAYREYQAACNKRNKEFSNNRYF